MASIFQKMSESSRLKRGLKTAVKGDPDARYKGPDGEILVHLKRHGAISKDGKDMAVLEFTVAPSEDHAGENIVNIYVFADNAAFTAEQTMGRFFGDLQILGIKTDGRENDTAGMEKDVNAVIASKTVFKLSIVGAQDKYPTVTLLGPADGEDSAPVAEDDEWEEETVVEEEVESLVGGICDYNDDTCAVDAHNEEAGTLTLSDPNDLETIWYEDVPVDDVKFQTE